MKIGIKKFLKWLILPLFLCILFDVVFLYWLIVPTYDGFLRGLPVCVLVDMGIVSIATMFHESEI